MIEGENGLCQKLTLKYLQTTFQECKKFDILHSVMINKLFFILIFLVISNVSFAAQCQALPEAQAKAAIALLNEYHTNYEIAVIDYFCESCRQERPRPIVIDHVKMSAFQVKGFHEIVVNNEAIDLAYIYLAGENLALKVGCQAQGVGKFL
jgi:hypothetical protein